MDNAVGPPITKVMDSKLAAFAFQHYIKILTLPCWNLTPQDTKQKYSNYKLQRNNFNSLSIKAHSVTALWLHRTIQI